MANNWSNAQQFFCEYTIGTVESRCDYAAVNLNDAITLGITQWWGYNAARLLVAIREQTPDSYAKLSQRIRDASETYSTEDANFWPNFYLTNDDGASFQTCAAEGAVHAVQDKLFLSDVFGEGNNLDRLQSVGVDGSRVKECIFLLAAYHQYPKSCFDIIRNIGGNRSLEDYLNAALNDGVLYKYSNRYNEIYQILSAWDGTSAPPDFGQSSEGLPENPDTNVGVASSVAYVEMINNQDIVIHGAMGSGESLICYYNGNNTWTPVRNASAPDYPSTGGGGAGAPEDFVAMKQLWEDNAEKWGYMQGPGRLDPPTYGYSDCSACIWWAANAATDNKYDWLGTSTYSQLTTTERIYSSPDGSIPLDILKPGDLFLMAYPGWDGGDVQHVDWYWGDGVAWGAGSAPLPRLVTNDVTTYYKNNVNWLHVHRFL